MFVLDLLAQGNAGNQIIAALRPETIWAWICYIVIVLNLAALFLQKEGSMQLTIFIAISTIAALINILGQSNQLQNTGSGVFNDMLQSNSIRFGNWIVMVCMFVFPLIFVGMTKSGRSRLPGILATIFAAIFLFGRWIAIILPKGG